MHEKQYAPILFKFSETERQRIGKELPPDARLLVTERPSSRPIEQPAVRPIAAVLISRGKLDDVPELFYTEDNRIGQSPPMLIADTDDRSRQGSLWA